jgi:hyperosmotically inducible periplasmic protein
MNIFKATSLSALVVAAAAMLATSLPLSASDTDERIESSAKATYVFQTYLKGDDIKFDSKDGVVTLTGTVATESHKAMAQEIVTDLPGVKSVNNDLTLAGEPSASSSDLWIKDKVKTTLLFHRSVSAVNTEVGVQDGAVTLSGVASSDAERELASEYARDVDGVKSVDNRMTVSGVPTTTVSTAREGSRRTTGEKIDDSSITTQVKMALLFHKSTSAIHTKVHTRFGEVTVSGSAHNAAEIRLVTKLVEDIHGVKGVRNEMTLEESK